MVIHKHKLADTGHESESESESESERGRKLHAKDSFSTTDNRPQMPRYVKAIVSGVIPHGEFGGQCELVATEANGDANERINRNEDDNDIASDGDET